MGESNKRKRSDILTDARVDPSVREIPSSAFADCRALVQVQLPATLTRIGEYAFRYCANLKCVQFVSNTSLEASSFNHSLENGLIEFPEKTVLRIDAYAFVCCHSLRKVIVSSVSTKLGIGAFDSCNGLICVELPQGLQCIESSLFCSCKSLVTVRIPSSVIKIGCVSIETLHIPHTVSTIEAGAFSSCEGLRFIKLPPTLEIIEDRLLEGCYMLEYIEIPTTVKKIGDMAFHSCNSLSHLRIPPHVGYIGNSAFSDCEGLISLEIPDRRFPKFKVNGKSWDICSCRKLANVMANPVLLLGNRNEMEEWLQVSKIGGVVDGYDDFLYKSNHRFDKSPLNKLCYYQSYYFLEDALVELGSLMEDNPLAATTQLDEFGMTPLHLLSLSQTPNLNLLLAVINGGPPDHIVLGRDSFGSTPMDYLCLNKMPSSTKVIQSLLQATFVKRVERLGLDRWKSDLLQSVDEALAMNRSSRSREIGLAHFQLANCERKEVSSLVELYLWKMKIDEVDRSADRRICRVNCGASIVIPHVLQFLDTLYMEEYFNSVL
eukprot:scaffold965_cov93-Cylindrotheca_fusiformis.AAC.2